MPKALVIDDEAALTAIISKFLERDGFRVEVANSGAEGLAMAIAEPPDVAIVDIMMPGMDGYEVCRRLRSDPRTAHMAILVLTARGQSVDRQMALRAGADAHITKPFNGKALVGEIQRLLVARARPHGGVSLGYQVLLLHLSEGAGATTVATNLALALSQRPEYLTVLADMVLRGGQVGERLGLTEMRSWLELPMVGVDELIAHLVRTAEGTFVLPAPPPQHIARFEPALLSEVLLRLRGWYDFVILDTPCNLGALAPVLMKSSSLVLLLLTPDPAALRTAQASLAAIKRFAGQGVQVWPVLNKMEDQDRAFREKVEQALGLRVAAVLPRSPNETAQAISDGSPVVVGAPDSPLARAFEALAQDVVRAGQSEPGEGQPG